MDNRIFNVNGDGKDWLLDAIKLALRHHFRDNNKIAGYKYYRTHGLVFLWHVEKDKGESEFPVPIDAETATNIALEWLKSKQSKEVPLEGWDANADHDGSNELGWRVYCEGWGHVADNHYALFAVKPAYLWYGK